MLDEHPLTQPELTGDWEQRLWTIEHGEGGRDGVHRGHRAASPTRPWPSSTSSRTVRVERAKLGLCPVCGRDVIENRERLHVLGKDEPGCGFVIWKKEAGKNLPVSVVKELIEKRATEKQVTGFRGRSGRTFRAKLRLEQGEDGKWRVEFNEDWANQPGSPRRPSRARARERRSTVE